MSKLPKPFSKSIIYDDENLYVCLARESIANGHTVVAWKENIADLSRMPDRSYDYLMDTVFAVRDALLKTLKVKKVYLLYMDEADHVHWHLIPRYKAKGFAVFGQPAAPICDFSLVNSIKKNLVFK